MEDIARPTPEHVKWAECEIGVIIHFDIQLFEPSYRFRKQWGYHPPASIFNPNQLDTDQWIETAKKAGAKYAVLVVKHCSGFCLWPSKAFDYTIKESPFREGEGDILRDFIKSCKKFGILPGIYYSTVCNAHELYDQPGNRALNLHSEAYKNYCALVETQLIELFTEYGELFEIWFDAGHLPNGPNITELLIKCQSKAICFQGPSDWNKNIRWVGNEFGKAPDPCWSTIDDFGHYDGTKPIKKINEGLPDGMIWMPAETDTPNRFLQWFWYKNQDSLVKSVDELVRTYYTSVGRNTNLLLGMVIDDRGLVPDKDKQVFIEFGKEIEKRFSTPTAQTSGKTKELLLELEQPCIINQIVLMEEISSGHLVRDYKIEGFINRSWVTLCDGKCIGHKKIHLIKPIELLQVRFKCINSVDNPNIKTFAVYHVPSLPTKLNLFKRIIRLIKIWRSLKTILL